MNESPQPQIRWWVIVLAVLVLGGVLYALIAAPRWITSALPSLPKGREEAPPAEIMRLPEEFTKTIQPKPSPAPEVSPGPAPPPAEPSYPPRQDMGTIMVPVPPVRQGILEMVNPFKGATPPAPHQASPSPTPAVAPAPAAPPKRWSMLAQGTRQSETKTVEAGKPPLPSEAQGLIQPARWAIPQAPLLTLYRSQVIPVRLLTALNSDLPGQSVFETTVPVFDKFHQGVTIIEKGSLLVAHQEGKPDYGQSRVSMKLDQLELPTGEIVALQAVVGDSHGANGLSGKVNNHYTKLLLATGISALLNIGARSAAGTPTGYQYNPAQDAAREIGSSVQRDAQGIVDKQLKVPPTITAPVGTIGTIQLQENVQFNRPPMVTK